MVTAPEMGTDIVRLDASAVRASVQVGRAELSSPRPRPRIASTGTDGAGPWTA